MRPLDGIVVLDLTRFLPGALATASLAAFGAEVIKIEKPESGDPARHIQGASWLFEETNRGKKSVALNLKDHRGKEAFLKLAKAADVLVESFRPGVMARLGLGYESLAALNQSLIYAAISGYGQDGPYSQVAGHDINYVAMSGLLPLLSPVSGPPLIPEIQIADVAVGSSQIVLGILLALQSRHTSGRGQRVDVSLAGGMADLLAFPLAALRARGSPVQRGCELLSGAYACYHLYRAKDGGWLAVGALEPKFWSNLCRQLQCEDLIADQFSPEPRQCHVKERLASAFAARTAQEWFALLHERDCCVTPVRTLQEAVADRRFDREPSTVLSATPGEARTCPAPFLGEHSIQVLSRSGVTPAQLRELESTGVIQVSRRPPTNESRVVESAIDDSSKV
ncbi:MAG TPA: CaiB/BaiF CoA-transferase family protein [Candidatus Acidoferrales bacterium]|nr:CaiB/BaiF CoA-transferase family protein [Candidatus Acidoferrales bacterium]